MCFHMKITLLAYLAQLCDTQLLNYSYISYHEMYGKGALGSANNNNNNTQIAAIALPPSTTHPQLWGGAAYI